MPDLQKDPDKKKGNWDQNLTTKLSWSMPNFLFNYIIRIFKENS